MKQRRKSLPSSWVWLTVFLPALSYYIATRLNIAQLWGRSSFLGIVTTETLRGECSLLQHVFYTTDCGDSDANTPFRLRHPLYLVQKDGLQDVVSTLWRHDSELGRGYLLLSQSHGSGRIWRWEVGGGPIPIGKTLHMEPSGCRSNLHRPCDSSSKAGSAGLAVDFLGQEHASEGRLVVTELGERRIVRMEESGARTPLVVHVPRLCPSAESMQRLQDPRYLLYTPFGNLLFTEKQDSCGGAILRLRNAMHIDPLSSATESRQAHSWSATDNHQEIIDVLYHGGCERVGGLALDSTWTGLYFTAVQNQSVLLMHLSLIVDEDEEEDAATSKNPADEQQYAGVLDGAAHLVHNLTVYHKDAANGSALVPGALAVDSAGNIFAAIPDGVLVLDKKEKYVGTLPMLQSPTSLTLAEDGFLYISTKDQLLRIMVKAGPVRVPTNLVRKH